MRGSSVFDFLIFFHKKRNAYLQPLTISSCCTKKLLMWRGQPGTAPAAIRLNSVVFPTPLAPTSPYLRPFPSLKVVLSSSWVPWYASVTPISRNQTSKRAGQRLGLKG